MSTEHNGLFTMLNGQRHLMNPADGKYYPIEDVREKYINKNTPKSPEELAFERAFEERCGFGARKGGPDGEGAKIGRIQYGSFFTEEYKTNFHTGTLIAFDFICPMTTGSNVDTWVYLTATNRTAKGAEAMVCYFGQSELCFKVFDWAREEPWQLTMSAEELKDYLITLTLGGVKRQVLLIQNVTYFVKTPMGEEYWINEVDLRNINKGGFSMVYQYIYQTTEEEQKSGEVGCWGPIVETFQDKFDGTNPLGFFETYVREGDENDKWTPYHLLTEDRSYISDESKGFKVEFLEPNHSFAVNGVCSVYAKPL